MHSTLHFLSQSAFTTAAALLDLKINFHKICQEPDLEKEVLEKGSFDQNLKI